jgi:EamA domain-containing membrane protein RarD
MVQTFIDIAMTISFGLYIIWLFTNVVLFGAVGVCEKNLFIQYTEWISGFVITGYGIYRLVRTIIHYRKLL